MTPPTRPQAEPRSAYKIFRPIGKRWSDNDVYSHANNVVYYSWFDTAVGVVQNRVTLFRMVIG